MRLAGCRRLAEGCALGAALAFAGCGGPGAKSSSHGQREGAPPLAQNRPAAAAQAPRGRDLQKVDVCQLLPGAVVAKTFGGTLRNASGSSNAVAADCTYSVQMRTPKTFIVYLYPPDHFAMLKEMSEKSTPVTGLGDGAFVEQDSGWYELKVLKKGDVTIDARGDTLEQAKSLAGLVLQRL